MRIALELLLIPWWGLTCHEHCQYLSPQRPKVYVVQSQCLLLFNLRSESTHSPKQNTLYSFWLDCFSCSHTISVFAYVKQIIFFIIFWGESCENLKKTLHNYPEITIIMYKREGEKEMTVIIVIHGYYSILCFWIDHMDVVNIRTIVS